MNPNSHHDQLPGEENEAANLTAHALGQLEGREREELLVRLVRPDAEEARRIVD